VTESEGTRILVADDESSVRELIVRALEPTGAHVVEASGGDEAIQALQSMPFDLVIVDIVMARGSGRDVLEALATMPQPPRCIVVSALADAWRARHVDDPLTIRLNPLVLAKPVDLGLLVMAVRRMLTGRLT
jgi:CheY-like chemotaxis protein